MSKRNYGIDLARLIFMFLICLHHVLGQGGVLNNDLLVNKKIYEVIFAITMIGVDGFAIISGYVAYPGNQKYEKIIYMWFQVLFYSFGMPFSINMLRLIFSKEVFSITEIVSGLFPVLNHKYWYFDAYIVLFFFMPFINKTLFSTNDKKCKKILIVLCVLISIMYLNNNASSHDFLSTGRSAFWLILLYTMGILIKKLDLFCKIKSCILFILFFILIFVSLATVGGNAMELSNINPIVLAESVIAVVLFSRFKPNEHIVSFLSPLSFGVFLFHANYYYRYYFLSERFLCTANLNTFSGFMSVIGFSLFTFIFGLFVDFIRKFIFEKLNIYDLSRKIFNKIDYLLDKIELI